MQSIIRRDMMIRIKITRTAIIRGTKLLTLMTFSRFLFSMQVVPSADAVLPVKMLLN